CASCHHSFAVSDLSNQGGLSMRRMISLLKDLSLLGIASILGLIALEVLVRFLIPQNIDAHNWNKFQRKSTRAGLEYELIPNARNDFYAGGPVRVNSLGFRDREFALHKSPGVFRVPTVGDSVTFGFGVPLEDTY